jgi:hypothetical protein
MPEHWSDAKTLLHGTSVSVGAPTVTEAVVG